jgi:hypothetical protein
MLRLLFFHLHQEGGSLLVVMLMFFSCHKEETLLWIMALRTTVACHPLERMPRRIMCG